MYLNLKPSIVMRGYKDYPYALVDPGGQHIKGRLMKLTRMQMETIQLGTARGVDAEDSILPAAVRHFLQKLLEIGVLEECGKAEAPTAWQNFRISKGRYTNGLLWSITGRCNLRCRHCYVTGGENKYGEPTFDECREVVRQMREANLDSVTLGGGEPLMRRDFWQLVDLLLENHIRISGLFTNGLLMNEAFFVEFQKRRLPFRTFNLSFDGVGCHDWLRGVPGTEEKTVEAIKLIKAHGYGVSVGMALHSGNAGSMLETYELMKSLQVDELRFSLVNDTGNWKQQEGHEVNIAIIYDAYLELIKRWKKQGRPLRISMGGFFSPKEDVGYETSYCGEHVDSLPREEYLCRPMQLSVNLLPNGKLISCSPTTDTEMERLAPNIFEPGQSIEQALIQSPVDCYLFGTYGEHFEKSPECLACPHRFCCRVCPAASLNAGDFFGRDPAACAFFKGNYKEKIAKIMNESQ